MKKHRTFLLWLLYILVVASLWASALAAGYPQLILAHDHSHMTAALTGLYALAEVVTFVQVLRVDRVAGDSMHRVLKKEFEVLEDEAHWGDFLAQQIVWLGIFATIAGVIAAFWPFLGAGGDVEAIKQHLGEFFNGVAVAFIPTAASFLFKTSLDVATRIIRTGLNVVRLGM